MLGRNRRLDGTHVSDIEGFVIVGGNLITAGGVTSGIDFGLRVVAEIAGESVAQAVQLNLEYDPDPPFASGHPDKASAAVKTMVAPRYEKARADFRAELSRVAAA